MMQSLPRYRMFSKPKVQKGIPRPKHLMSTTVGTRQPSLYSSGTPRKRPRREGEVRRVKRGKKGGGAAQETERMQDSQPDGTEPVDRTS
jgi:hypothetical protein